MFKKFVFFSFAALMLTIVCFVCSNCRAIRRDGDAKPISHAQWDALLKKHVAPGGFVRYKAWVQDSAALNRYLDIVRSAHPNDKNWSRAEQMAYWINTYNAFTVQLILRNYPVESIKDIKKGLAFVNSVWDVKFIKIQGYTYDLNNIEHNILRPVFKDARIHAAINCASYSCPQLRAEAFTADRLEAQLDDAMRSFVNDPLRNRISPEKAEISSIFKWFKGDFDRDAGSVSAFLRRYNNSMTEKTDISHLDYDWKLNDALTADGEKF